MKSEEKKEIVRRIISILLMGTFLIVATYYFYLPKKGIFEDAVTYAASQGSISMEDITEGIRLSEAYPVEDEEGMAVDPYRFKVVNYGKKTVTYQITFKNDIQKIEQQGAKALEGRYLRYTLQPEKKPLVEAENLPEDSVIATYKIAPGEEQVFSFKIWLDFEAENGAQNKSFCGNMAVQEIRE